MNIGDLRKLIADLPDDAPIRPDFSDAPPDEMPSVILDGFAVATEDDERGAAPGPRYLSVLVRLDIDEDEDPEPYDEGYQQGQEARAAGEAEDENPHQAPDPKLSGRDHNKTQEWEGWRDGWNDADKEDSDS